MRERAFGTPAGPGLETSLLALIVTDPIYGYTEILRHRGRSVAVEKIRLR
jgi:hypothetical protein